MKVSQDKSQMWLGSCKIICLSYAWICWGVSQVSNILGFFAMDFQCSDAAADWVQLELRLFMPRRAGAEYCCLELAWLNRICVGLWVEFILTSWRLLQEILMIQVNPVFVSSSLAVSCHGGQVLCNFEYCHVCVIKPLDFLSVLYLVSFNRCKWNKLMYFNRIKHIFWKNEIICVILSIL